MKISTILFYLGIIINISETNANGLSNKQNKKILQDFFKRNDIKDILLEIIQEDADTPFIQNMLQAFKKSFSQSHIHNTLVNVLTLLNTNVIYPFYSNENNVDYRDVGNIADNPTKILQYAVGSTLLSKLYCSLLC